MEKWESDQCVACGTEKVCWNQVLMCVLCDNRDDSTATWFVALAENDR